MLEKLYAPMVSRQQSVQNASASGSSRSLAKTIAFVNQKGGSGKTTITQNLAVCLALQHDKRVLCVDLDPQGNLGQSLHSEPISTTRTADRLLLVPSAKIAEYIIPVRPQIDLIPNRYQRDLRENVERLPFTENLLRRHLHRLREKYDYILIDTPAGLSRSTQAGVEVADQVVIVVSCGSYALKGASALVSWVTELCSKGGRKPPELRVVLNNYDERQRFDRELRREVEYIFGESLFQSQIRNSMRIVEAAAQAMSVIEYPQASIGATDFKRLGRELLGLPLSAPSISLETDTPETAVSVPEKKLTDSGKLRLVS
jgi:chromosome partitioning protein